MTDEHLYVIAKIVLRPEFFSEGKQAIIGILDVTRSEEGCKQFELHQDELTSTLFLYEEWVDDAALQKHYDQPYTKSVFAKYTIWLLQPIEVYKISKVYFP